MFIEYFSLLHRLESEQSMPMSKLLNIESDEFSDLKIVYLQAEDLKLAVSLTWQAYQEDSVFKEIFQSETPGYEQRLRAAIREEIGALWEAQDPMIGLFDGERLLGVACVVAPESTLEHGRFWHWRLKMLLSAGYVSSQQLIQKDNDMRQALPGKQLHLLSFIAIQPNHQQKGLGQFLLRAVGVIADESTMSDGIAALVTAEQYENLFLTEQYQLVDNINIGSVAARLYFCEKEE